MDQPDIKQYFEERIPELLQTEPLSKQELRQKLRTTEEETSTFEKTLVKLRKEGKIVFIKDTWALHTCAICETCGGKGWVQK